MNFSRLIFAAALSVMTAQMASAAGDPATAPTGTYKLDNRHASATARIGHNGGVSLTTVRFNMINGSLKWNPANVQSSSVNVEIDMTSLDSPVPGFADELIGEGWLKTSEFPKATFVSTAVSTTGPTTGRIMGNLTFMGVTKPVAIDARFVGAGLGMGNTNSIGFSGTMNFKRSDFGFTKMVGPVGDDVELIIDVEFNKPVGATN